MASRPFHDKTVERMGHAASPRGNNPLRALRLSDSDCSLFDVAHELKRLVSVRQGFLPFRICR